MKVTRLPEQIAHPSLGGVLAQVDLSQDHQDFTGFAVGR